MDRIIIIDDDGIRKNLNDFIEANKDRIRLNSDVIELSSGKDSLLKEIINKYEDKFKLKIHSKDSVYLFRINEIIYLEAKRNTTLLHQSKGDALSLEGYLDTFAEQFSDYPFLNIHPDYIININFILSILQKEKTYVKLSDGSEIPVSEYRKEIIIREIEKYI